LGARRPSPGRYWLQPKKDRGTGVARAPQHQPSRARWRSAARSSTMLDGRPEPKASSQQGKARQPPGCRAKPLFDVERALGRRIQVSAPGRRRSRDIFAYDGADESSPRHCAGCEHPAHWPNGSRSSAGAWRRDAPSCFIGVSVIGTDLRANRPGRTLKNTTERDTR